MTKHRTEQPATHVSDHQAIFAMLQLTLPESYPRSPVIDWRDTNHAQWELLRSYHSYRYAAITNGLTAIASAHHSDIDAFLSAYGYKAAAQSDGSGSHSVGAVRQVTLDWPGVSQPTSIECCSGAQAHSQPALLLPASSFEILYASGFGKPLIKIPLASGQLVWVTKESWSPDMGDLANFAFELTSGNLHPYFPADNPYGSLRLPILSCKQGADLTWVHGIHSRTPLDARVTIRSATYHFELELGRATQAGSAVAPTGSYTFDSSFLLFVTPAPTERSRGTMPDFAAWISTSAWH
jgi:hypothetical protein